VVHVGVEYGIQLIQRLTPVGAGEFSAGVLGSPAA
jgi:hypothetical protein